jgi:predicted MPP superfamily phosphohydrolase
MYRLVFFILFVFLLEWYAFQAFKTITKVKWVHYSYIFLMILFVAFIIYSFSQFDRSVGQNKHTLFTMGLLLVVTVPKLLLVLVLMGEDIFRILMGVITYFKGTYQTTFLPERVKFISQMAVAIAIIPVIALLYGMFSGKYNYKVIEQTISFKDLPPAFDGFKIVQISDIHSGSLDNPSQIQKAIDLINAQNADLILFTGDIVNTHATEMEPWIEVFKNIQDVPFGKYSVLGNHDYGEYIKWPSQEAKSENFKAIKNIHPRIHFELLLNENKKLTKNGDTLFLVGVENWGHNFKKAGDLIKASEGLKTSDFKILLSHDPSHWEYEVKNHPLNFHLTLSGHTHGLQFGFEIPGIFKWSPVQYVYKQWAGSYENAQRFLYVNRGFGFHAYPGRVGIWPEITVIQLKKASIE